MTLPSSNASSPDVLTTPSHETKSDVVTLGCRLNTLESEVMRDQLAHAGIHDAVIINTCAVTAEAERQARQTIRKMRRDRPQAQIIVTGCAAQLDPEKFAAMAEVDRVVGNHDKLNVQGLVGLQEKKSDQNTTIHVTDIAHVKETANHLVSGLDGRTRAFVLVQQGCDNTCTFCIIPAARGKNRAVPLNHISTQVQTLVANGHKEVVLTGVDIAAYGQDLGLCDENGTALPQIIRKILSDVPDLRRLRLSSLDPARLNDDFFDLFAHEPRLMAHLHLSLQAADDMTLTRMKRRHRVDDISRLIARAKAARPAVVFGADLIAGFPTETETMFQTTCDNIQKWGLHHLHVFPYSQRPNTPAARMPQLSGPIIKSRAKTLRTIGETTLTHYFESLVGTVQDILVEKEGFGRTQGFAPVRFDSVPSDIPAGSIVDVQITGHNEGALVGTYIHKDNQHRDGQA